MKTGTDGIEVMHFYEDLRLEAYPDPGTGGAPWTIGYGDTGPDVKKGLVITVDEANARFARRLAREFEPGVSGAVKRVLTQRQFDALVSFAYNVGVDAFKKSSLLRLVNACDDQAAADQFLRWDRSGGRRMLGLYRRRVSESRLWLGADYLQAIKIGQAVKVLP